MTPCASRLARGFQWGGAAPLSHPDGFLLPKHLGETESKKAEVVNVDDSFKKYGFAREEWRGARTG